MNSEMLFCACCGEENEVGQLTRIPKILFQSSAVVHECLVCGCGITNPVPNISDSYYVNNAGYEETFKNNTENFTLFANDCIDTLESLGSVSGKKLLDVACGGGFLVDAAVKRGIDAVGIDTNEKMVDWAAARGCNVIKGDILELDNISESYDFIVFSHILEHLEDPVVILEHCARLLSLDGKILVSQTDHGGLLPKYFPWLWYGWQTQEHYWHFTPESFDRLAERAGLTLSHVKAYTLHQRFGIYNSFKDTVGKNIGAAISAIGERTGRKDAFHAVYSSVGR